MTSQEVIVHIRLEMDKLTSAEMVAVEERQEEGLDKMLKS